jgi:DNA-binding transcriptional LysR family regulator
MMHRFTWDDLQFFLAVGRTGQLSAAARKLRTNHATVSRRIDRLEQALATKLFERSPRGYTLTALGERLIESAEIMEREAANFHNEAVSGAAPVSGVVRISTLEGFGNYFLADRLPLLAQSQPGLSIEVLTIQQIVSLSRREADITITLNAPKAGPYHTEKITTYRLFVYGHRDYVARHAPVQCRIISSATSRTRSSRRASIITASFFRASAQPIRAPASMRSLRPHAAGSGSASCRTTWLATIPSSCR